MTVPFIEENDQTQARREHLEALRTLVGNVYPNKFGRSNVTDTPAGEDTITSVVASFRRLEPKLPEGQKPSPDELELANAELNQIRVRLAGRISAPPRVMGKAAFVHLSDGVSRLQIYVRRQDVVGVRNDVSSSTNLSLSDTVDGWELFGLLDHGDFIGVEGYLFVTKTGELSVHVEKLQFLAKALLPMPDKMHGINDPEIRRRQRYADLIAGSLKLERDENNLSPREVFQLRSKVIREIRRFLDERSYIEVETPMLTPLATGAAAKPFSTYHNALGIPLYARIAPELYLKRLVVGGFEKVYELNRNFRNEGISTKHNPEFTMLEFYWAYADVNQMMDLCEEMMRSVVKVATGGLTIRYGEQEIDFSKPFHRITMKDAIAKYWPSEWSELAGQTFNREWLDDPHKLGATWLFLWKMNKETRLSLQAQEYWGMTFDAVLEQEMKLIDDVHREQKDLVWTDAIKLEERLSRDGNKLSQTPAAQIVTDLFEKIAETKLIQPSFITDFPKPVSPLSKASPSDPSVAERFEYFVGGLESANGFSELNDPEEQYQRTGTEPLAVASA